MKPTVSVFSMALAIATSAPAFAEPPATAGVSVLEPQNEQAAGTIAPSQGVGALGAFTTGQLILGGLIIGTIIAATNDGGSSSRGGTTGTTP